MFFNACKNNQSGNILIYILGAIFLMGLLVIVARGSFSPGAGIDEETLLIRVAEVQEYGSELERAVQYILANGYSETDIRFAHPDADAAYGLITDDPARQVFAREGGGAQYRDIPRGIQVVETPWFFTGRSDVNGVGTLDKTDGNVSSSELIVMLNFVTKDFCLSVNSKSNIINIGTDPPQDSGNINLNVPFVGSYENTTSIGDTLVGNTFGRLEGCVEGDVSPLSGTYHYYRVLLAR